LSGLNAIVSAESEPSPDADRPADAPPSSDPVASPPDEAAAADDLPEWEPLSPEILEDEAIRGDFVLRWAVVGLALLWGCTEIADARVLVHARTGAWLVQQGVLPPANDPFSLTAGDRRWVNLSWLFDLFVAGGAQAGPVALSILQALLAAAAFGLLGLAVRPGIRTWWGSICGVLALLAAYQQLELRPELMTLVGLAAVLAILIGSESPATEQRLWWLPAVMFVWAQSDPRCWIGVALLMLALVGRWFGSGTAGRLPMAPLLVAIGVTLLHPFFGQPWLAAWRQYAVEYPALRDAYPRPSVIDWAWYPLWSSWVWTPVSQRVAAGLFLAAAAAVAMWLNRTRVTLTHGLWFVGGNVLGVVALHEWPVAAFINAALATVHGQEWYKHRFGQVYSVAALEIAFSRGGRALTVLAMLGLAWLAISGRIDGPDGHRTGLGLSRSLAAELDSLKRLDDVAYDDRGFHFTLRQGDALIAAGRKSYVDHRVALFTGNREDDILTRHQLMRRVFRPSTPPPLSADDVANVEDWLAEDRISHVLPRLNAAISPPDYRTFIDLLSNPAWTLTDVLPTVGVYHRTTGQDPGLAAFLETHRFDVLDRAFRQPADGKADPLDPIRPPTWSEQLLSRGRQSLAAGTLEASHWLRLGEAVRTAPIPFHLACGTLAVRAARRGVRETPGVAEAHRMLAEACQILGMVESATFGERHRLWTQSPRFYEAVAAARQAETLQPSNANVAALQYELWRSSDKVDAAETALARLLALQANRPTISDQEFAQRTQWESEQQQLAGLVADVQLRSEAALAQGQNRLEVAAACHQAGCLRLAVKLLTDDIVLVEQQPQARLLLTLWLAELGDTEELIDSAARLQAVAPRGIGVWQDAFAYAALVRADFASAIATWQSTMTGSRANELQSLLYTTPLSTSSEVWLGDLAYPVAHLAAVQEAGSRSAAQQTAAALNVALCAIEQGDPDKATTALHAVLETSAESPLRPLVRMYWYGLQGAVLPDTDAADQIPMPDSLITPEP
jgi:hypothetical protein